MRTKSIAYGLRAALVLAFALVVLPALAQDTVSVPDVSGLSVPQAAAQLNAAGLRLGAQTAELWTDTSPSAPGTVFAQSIAPGQQIANGTSVDLTVLTDATVTLIYDDNDFTMINKTGITLDLTRLTFNSASGTQHFAATRWRGDLKDGDCAQVWSISRRDPKQVEGCNSIYWLTTNNTSEHFWTKTANPDTFVVVQDGVTRATCDSAGPEAANQPLTCEFVLVVGSGDVTPYLYFTYTTDRLAVINTSTDQWMPLAGTNVYNFNPNLQVSGAALGLGDSTLYDSIDPVADVQRLAPGQCVLLTAGSIDNAAPPESCNVIAQLAVSPNLIFWGAAFELDDPLSSGHSQCPAATENRRTVCIMPR